VRRPQLIVNFLQVNDLPGVLRAFPSFESHVHVLSSSADHIAKLAALWDLEKHIRSVTWLSKAEFYRVTSTCVIAVLSV
jgi:hypothetical protein